MTQDNFNWFIHAMLWYHTKYVIKNGDKKNADEKDAESDEE
jgi:hypothetical protein